jgi:hypothetical protein
MLQTPSPVSALSYSAKRPHITHGGSPDAGQRCDAWVWVLHKTK